MLARYFKPRISWISLDLKNHLANPLKLTRYFNSLTHVTCLEINTVGHIVSTGGTWLLPMPMDDL